MAYDEAISYLDSFLNYETTRLNANLPRAFNLQRMERLLAAMGNPHLRTPTLHVAGTKGKGSTCAFLESVLRAAGYRTGLYTQPHLISPRERLRVNGKCISEADFADLTERLKPLLEIHRETDDGRLTFFEVYTAMVFRHFADVGVEVTVLEVGMGGRLDATNVVRPMATAITPIGIDHTAILGDTLEAIAYEKAGIVKERCPLILAPQKPSARNVILRVAEQRNAPVSEVGVDVCLNRIGIRDEREIVDFKWDPLVFPRGRGEESDGGRLNDIRLRMLGAHQSVNAATAVGVLLKLRDAGWNLSDGQIRTGLETATMAGRFQCTHSPHGNTLILDGAHTEESAAALRRTLTEAFGGEKFLLVVGMSTDKEMGRFAAALAPSASRVVLTRAGGVFRAAEPDELVSVWRNHVANVSTAPSVREAVLGASEEERICVTGSLYLVGEAMATVAPEAYAAFQDEVNL